MRHPHLGNVLPLGEVMGEGIYPRRPQTIELAPPITEYVREFGFVSHC
jgi:hypothetical protein